MICHYGTKFFLSLVYLLAKSPRRQVYIIICVLATLRDCIGNLCAFVPSWQIEIATTINALTDKQTKLNETLQKLSNKLEFNTNKEEKTSSGKLIVQVMANTASLVPLEVSYLTQSCKVS